MLHGQNPFAPVLFGWLNLSPDDVGRFRDIYLAKGADGAPRVVVFTRNGGGNREDHEAITDALRAHPLYVTDYDDDFDCTYASYEFRVPDVWRAAAEGLMDDTPPPMERMRLLIEKLHAAPTDPESRRAVEAVRPLIEKIAAVLGKPA